MTAALALRGIDPWDWSARLLLDVIAYLAAQGEDDPLKAARTEAELQPGGMDDWGKVTPEQARRIVAEQGG